MMSDAEIDELARDIFENGLREPVDIFVDNREEANGSPGPFPEQLMDGRNRLEALRRLGHNSPLEVNTKGIRYHYAIVRRGKKWVAGCDPVKFILSKNVYRRHLTPQQRRDAIARYIKADPRLSDHAIAKDLKVDDKTVAKVRKESVPNLENPKMEHLPVERAKAAVRANPQASVSAIAESANVGRATAQRAQKLVAAESKLVAFEPEPEPKSELEAADILQAKRTKRIMAKGSPELELAVEKGEISLSAASMIAKLPKDEQAEIIAKGAEPSDDEPSMMLCYHLDEACKLARLIKLSDDELVAMLRDMLAEKPEP
jgi:hypothetical protein